MGAFFDRENAYFNIQLTVLIFILNLRKAALTVHEQSGPVTGRVFPMCIGKRFVRIEWPFGINKHGNGLRTKSLVTLS
jgi:hypothetical protein